MNDLRIRSKKRERSVNFIPAETAKLIDLVALRRYIIENKKSDGVTWKRKERAWKAIEFEFNRSNISDTYRKAKHLKIKYEALKRDTRRKTKYVRSKSLDINVDGCEMISEVALTSVEAKVQNMISPPNEVNGSLNDSDHFENQTIEDVIKTQPSDIELDDPLFKKECILEDETISEPEVSKSDKDKIEPESIWVNCKNYSNTAKNSGLSRPIEKRLLDTGEENEIFELQRKVLEEELEEKHLKKILLDKEIQHKTEMYELEKEEMRLKVELLKVELAKLIKNDV